MSYNFPPNPDVGDEYVNRGIRWVWDSQAWVLASPIVAPTWDDVTDKPDFDALYGEPLDRSRDNDLTQAQQIAQLRDLSNLQPVEGPVIVGQPRSGEWFPRKDMTPAELKEVLGIWSIEYRNLLTPTVIDSYTAAANNKVLVQNGQVTSDAGANFRITFPVPFTDRPTIKLYSRSSGSDVGVVCNHTNLFSQRVDINVHALSVSGGNLVRTQIAQTVFWEAVGPTDLMKAPAI